MAAGAAPRGPQQDRQAEPERHVSILRRTQPGPAHPRGAGGSAARIPTPAQHQGRALGDHYARRHPGRPALRKGAKSGAHRPGRYPGGRQGAGHHQVEQRQVRPRVPARTRKRYLGGGHPGDPHNSDMTQGSKEYQHCSEQTPGPERHGSRSRPDRKDTWRQWPCGSRGFSRSPTSAPSPAKRASTAACATWTSQAAHNHLPCTLCQGRREGSVEKVHPRTSI